VRALGQFAAAAPVAVFPAVGPGLRSHVEDLALRAEVELVETPRHANVLLVAGTIPAEHREALARVHDQLPNPRATLRWGAEAGRDEGGPGDPVPRLVALGRELLLGERPSEAPLLADEPPHPWRGRGDHGQGGEGMMGGTPYGRPMAMTGDDLRDGLALDRLEFTIGPFFPHLPPGLVLRLVLQGDVVQETEVVSGPYPQPPASPLRRISRLLRATGAPSLAERALRLAVAEPEPAARQVAAFSRRLRQALPPALENREPLAIEHLPHLLPGMEWGRAVATLAGLPAPLFALSAFAPSPIAPSPIAPQPDSTPPSEGSWP